MRGTWTIATELTRCGADSLGHAVTPGDRVYVMGRMVRCEVHAPWHVSADPAEVVAARQHADAQRTAQGILAPKPSSDFTPIDEATPYAAMPERSRERVSVSQPKPFHEVADDPAVVRAGSDK